MTLIVLAYRRMPDNTLADIPLDSAHDGDSTMAGFESMRWKFYDGEAASRLNLRLLPQLATADLWVEGKHLADLNAETSLLLQNLAPEEVEYWSYRLGNIVNAIERASVFGDEGVVYIG